MQMLDGPFDQQLLGGLIMYGCDANFKVKAISAISALLAEAMTNAMRDQLWNCLVAVYGSHIVQAGQNQNDLLTLPTSANQ